MKNIILLAAFWGLFSLSSSTIADTFTFKKGLNVSHWMAQHAPGAYASPEKFNQDDALWIAAQGYDHLRIPVDGRILFNTEDKLITELLQPMTKALVWARENKLGVIFDMHYLPGNAFLNAPQDNLLWTDPNLMKAAADYWRQLAEFYKGEDHILRFEILNEAVAPDNQDVNRLNKALVRAIRTVDTDRIVYVSSNLWGQFATADDVHVFEDDPNVHYAFHYYNPMFFTHQKASWTDFGHMYNQSVTFPDTLTDLEDYFPSDHYALDTEHREITEALVRREFAGLGDWAKKHNATILVSEFGVINYADDESKTRWATLVRSLCEQYDFGWSVWDYKSSFAMRGEDGKPTATQRALLP